MQLSAAFNNSVSLLMDRRPARDPHASAELANPLFESELVRWTNPSEDGSAFKSCSDFRSFKKAPKASDGAAMAAARTSVLASAAGSAVGTSVLLAAGAPAGGTSGRGPRNLRTTSQSAAERAELDEADLYDSANEGGRFGGRSGRCSKSIPTRTSLRGGSGNSERRRLTEDEDYAA